ncbi:hypothetical protein DITRI_Ditri09bG0103300 [Diplodiscus trichospermus]
MASDECQGKRSWPELLRTKGEEAATTIGKENPNVNAVIVTRKTVVLPVFLCTRVLVLVDTNGIVTMVRPLVKKMQRIFYLTSKLLIIIL